MQKANNNLLPPASTKSSEPLRLEETLPLLDLILESQQEIEAVSLNLGLKIIMSRYLEAGIGRRQGTWGQQTHYRHGTQPGYVVFHGRKAPIKPGEAYCGGWSGTSRAIAWATSATRCISRRKRQTTS